MSPFRFIRRFHAVFGSTPHQFRIDTRLNRAKVLLAGRDLSVTDVCLEVGFTSLGTFSDLFARRVGAPPSAGRRFRKRCSRRAFQSPTPAATSSNSTNQPEAPRTSPRRYNVREPPQCAT